MSNVGQRRVPDLSAYGVQLSDAGGLCTIPPATGDCGAVRHGLRAGVSGQAGTVPPGGTAEAGGISTSSSAFDEVSNVGNCDGKSTAVLGGFRVPVPHPLY